MYSSQSAAFLAGSISAYRVLYALSASACVCARLGIATARIINRDKPRLAVFFILKIDLLRNPRDPLVQNKPTSPLNRVSKKFKIAKSIKSLVHGCLRLPRILNELLAHMQSIIVLHTKVRNQILSTQVT